MNRRHNARLAALTKQLDEAPIAASVLESAFDTFRSTGVLPTLPRAARAVVDRALQESGHDEEHVDLETGLQRMSDLLDSIDAGEMLPPDRMETRKHLLDAAVNGSPAVQKQARRALRMLTPAGHDVADNHVLEKPGPPELVAGLIDEVCAHHVARDAAEDPAVGPPAPKGQALFDQMRDVLRLASELMPSPCPAASRWRRTGSGGGEAGR